MGYADKEALKTLTRSLMRRDDTMLNGANEYADGVVESAKKTLNDRITTVSNNIYAAIQSVDSKFEIDVAKKAKADRNGNVIDETYMRADARGAINGVAPLNSSKKIDKQYLPSYVDDVIDVIRERDTSGVYRFYLVDEDGNKASEITQGESGKIYVAKDQTTWRWSGSEYVQIKGDLIIGTMAGTAFDGARGAAVESGLKNLKEYTANPGGMSQLTGTITNNGNITLFSGGTSNQTELKVGSTKVTINEKRILTEDDIVITEPEVSALKSAVNNFQGTYVAKTNTAGTGTVEVTNNDSDGFKVRAYSGNTNLILKYSTAGLSVGGTATFGSNVIVNGTNITVNGSKVLTEANVMTDDELQEVFTDCGLTMILPGA